MSAAPQPDPTPRARSRVAAGAALILVLAGVAAAVLAALLSPGGAVSEVGAAPLPSASPPTDSAGSTTAGAEGAAPLLVHVLGRVREPGVYELAAGSRAMDAVAAAGGFARGADRGALNLAKPVTDGEQLLVPKQGAGPPAAGNGDAGGAPAVPGSPAAPGAPIDLNTADAAALDTLPRIGPAIATRILQWREANGRFASVEDLLDVPGIGEATLEGLRELVTV
ncbi:ComEA family DNA-binding protein [Homoserinibacter sp. YIM 151385]|uniref:ComEA family DNA-binding protein n=1 Tax=Homoserinibacter sp. YIM 151385 TaxID=2985506 RepID=UPI0022F091FF|nr:ComEA family DNA-binding protein [Homoserinibacter sp. YIM 151385]WBU38947.1 ComEA family DNA-binding protein [Homoserinibacter sp. YIM 151385]